MSVFKGMKALYPNAIDLVDYAFRDDGKGPYLEFWDEKKLGPKPELKELESAGANVPPDVERATFEGIRAKVKRGEDITASEVKFAVIQWLKGK